MCVKILLNIGAIKFMEKQKIYYLDNASASQMSNEAYREMLDAYSSIYANPECIYKLGREALDAVNLAKEKIAKAIGASVDEIILTSGEAESNNLAIKGIARANRKKGNHIITSVIEDESVLDSCKALEKEGFVVTYIPVDENGLVKYSEVVKAIGPNTILITISLANAEVGTVQPIRAIAELAKANEVVFHTDASQAIGMIDLSVRDIGVDSLSLSAHLFGGAMGVGALYVKKGTAIQKLIDGRTSEDAYRAGALDVPAVVAMGKAIEEVTENVEERSKYLKSIRRYFLKKISEAIHNIQLNGHPTQRLANHASLSFEGADGEAVAVLLDKEGIYVSTSASAGRVDQKPSYVLKAMGKDIEWAETTIRFSFGTNITKEDVDELVEKIRKIVKKVRSISAIRIYKNKVEL